MKVVLLIVCQLTGFAIPILFSRGNLSFESAAFLMAYLIFTVISMIASILIQMFGGSD